jgi:hypothetical protein
MGWFDEVRDLVKYNEFDEIERQRCERCVEGKVASGAATSPLRCHLAKADPVVRDVELAAKALGERPHQLAKLLEASFDQKDLADDALGGSDYAYLFFDPRAVFFKDVQRIDTVRHGYVQLLPFELKFGVPRVPVRYPDCEVSVAKLSDCSPLLRFQHFFKY